MTLVLLETKDILATRTFSLLPVQMEVLDFLALLEISAGQASLEMLVLMARREKRVTTVVSVQQDLQDTRETQAKMDDPDETDIKDFRVEQGQRERREFEVRRAKWACEGCKDGWVQPE